MLYCSTVSTGRDRRAVLRCGAEMRCGRHPRLGESSAQVEKNKSKKKAQSRQSRWFAAAAALCLHARSPNPRRLPAAVPILRRAAGGRARDRRRGADQRPLASRAPRRHANGAHTHMPSARRDSRACLPACARARLPQKRAASSRPPRPRPPPPPLPPAIPDALAAAFSAALLRISLADLSSRRWCVAPAP